ncbi:MAG: hypothetical protein ACHQF2_03490 [Flavobacteriales bacterium]
MIKFIVMKLQVFPIQYSRFDVNEKIMKARDVDITQKAIQTVLELGEIDSKPVFNLRWQIHVIDNFTKQEAVGLLVNHKAFYKLENKEKDIQSLSKFIHSSFINIREKLWEEYPCCKKLLTDPIDYDKSATGFYDLFTT